MKTRTTRVIALSLCMLSIFGALVYRLIQLQLIQGGQTAESLNAHIIRNYDELPLNCRRYLETIEEKLGVKIAMVSVGPDKEANILREELL